MRSRRARRRSADQLPASFKLECQHCHGLYEPVKRGTQKFCSSSCRSTHSKQKKAGTLGKITSLPGPARGGLSFLETVAAAGLGASAANAGEYLLVTHRLLAHQEQQHQQLTAITDLLHQGALAYNHLQQHVTQLTQALSVALQALDVAPALIVQLLPPPVPVAATPALPDPLADPVLPSEPELTPEQQAIYAQLVAAWLPPQTVPEARPARARRPKNSAEQPEA